MSVQSDVLSGVRGATAPPAPAGNPAILGLVTFLPAGLTLGFWLVGYLPVTIPGGMIATAVGSAGLFLLVSCLWAARLGASAVAGILGLFSAFFTSLAVMLFGLANGLFGLADSSEVPKVLVPYALSFLIVFGLVTLGTLRLPLAFTAGFVFIDATFALLIANLLTGTALYATLAGICTFVFCAIYAYILLDAITQETGGNAMPLGGPVTR